MAPSEPDSSLAGKPRLLDRARVILRANYYSRRTEEVYLGWMRRFILFHGKRHPQEMGGAEVAAFLTDLTVRGAVSASTQNQAFSALLFLYAKVLGQPLGEVEPVVRATRPKKIPVVLTRQEARGLLGQLEGVEWIMASLLYGSGLRLLEMLRLRVKDVDIGYGQITIAMAREARTASPCSRKVWSKRCGGIWRAANWTMGGMWRQERPLFTCRKLWLASIPRRPLRGFGSMCSRQRSSRGTRVRTRGAGIMSMK